MAWALTLRYISAPILAIVFSFAYPSFHKLRNDPLHIFCFAWAHLVMLFVVGFFIVPRALDVFVPIEKREVNVELLEGDVERMGREKVVAGSDRKEDSE